MNSIFLSIIGGGLPLLSLFVWFRGAGSLGLSRSKRTVFVAIMLTSLVFGIAAVVCATGWPEYAASTPSILIPCLFLFLNTRSRQSNQPPSVRVGDRYLDFSARDENGETFTLSSMDGSAFILKFYRGHWCPYCMGELSEWGKMLPELKKLGVQELIYVSTDTPEGICKGKHKHKVIGIQISDSQLEITRLYQVENRHTNITPPGVSVPGLPIPTTILIDATGAVRWIDQAEDYQVRAQTSRVLRKIKAANLSV